MDAVAVTPRAATATSVVTGGTPISCFTGPCNGFLLQAGAAAIFYSLTGAAATTIGGGTFSLAVGQWLLWDDALPFGFTLSVNAVASSTGFSCVIW